MLKGVLLHLGLKKKKMISIQLDYCSIYILKIFVMTSGKYRCQNVTCISANDTQSILAYTDWPGTQIFWSILFSPCQSCSFPCSPPPHHCLRMANEQPHAYSQGYSVLIETEGLNYVITSSTFLPCSKLQWSPFYSASEFVWRPLSIHGEGQHPTCFYSIISSL